jgi:hypothetical protein
MRLPRVSFPRAFGTALVSLLVHDVLDLAQATDRGPWWPLSDRPVGFDVGLIPTGLLREAAVFGGLLLAFLHVGARLDHGWGDQLRHFPNDGLGTGNLPHPLSHQVGHLIDVAVDAVVTD